MVEAGTLLQNRYLVQKQIGAGGMGTVYVAVDQRFNSFVAIKETLFDEANLRLAFEREAQLLNSLRHPALPHVIDYFAENERQYLVMEYFAGEDLSETLKRKRSFPIADVLRWADDLLDALVYLHSQKTPVVHRDIKPQNLKFTPRGEIILLDFGLAKGKPGDDSQISRINSIFGYSRNYAPLEQIQGTGTDVRSDIYSLGATVYHLLTGKPPVDALTRATTFVNKQTDPLVPANALNNQISLEIAEILRQTLELNPDLRPQTALQLRESLGTAEKTSAEALTSDVTKIHVSTSNSALTTDFPVAVPLTVVEKAVYSGSFKPPLTTNNNFASEPPAQINSFDDPSEFGKPQAGSLRKSVIIAAVILILGSVSVAAWYATNQSLSGSKQTVNSNSVVGVLPEVKPANINGNAKTEVKIEEKTASSKVNSNQTNLKQTELSNKSAAIRIPSPDQTLKENPLPAPPPIIVKSAPPTETSKRSNEKDELDPPIPLRRKAEAVEPENLDESIDKPRKRANKNQELLDENRSERMGRREERRERRVLDKRKRQKLPTLLGAPQ